MTATPGGRYALSTSGAEALAGLAPADFNATGRVLYDCVDWSERRDHFAGPLAVAWLDALLTRGWLRRVADSRELQATPAGVAALPWALRAEA